MPCRKVEVVEYECVKCSHRWINRVNGKDGPKPIRCAKCKRWNWEGGILSLEEKRLRRRRSKTSVYNSFNEPDKRKRQYKPLKKVSQEQVYEGSLGINGINMTAKLVRILAGEKKDERSKYDEALITKGRDWRLREMKRMSVEELNMLYNHLSFLQKLINETLQMLAHEVQYLLSSVL